MRKKWMNYLTITIIVFLIIFYYNEISPMILVCFGIVLASHLYDLFKDKF